MTNIISQTDIQQGLKAARIERARLFVGCVAALWQGILWMPRSVWGAVKRKVFAQTQTAA